MSSKFISACQALLPLVALLTRLALAIVFLKSGWSKWSDIAGTTEQFAGLKIPAPAANAYLVATVELLGGISMLLGAFTRVFALLLSATMVVAIVTVHWPDIRNWLQFGETSFPQTVALPILLLLLWLVVAGPGRVSVDHVLARRRSGGK